jgi:type VI secretion system protein ImpM
MMALPFKRAEAGAGATYTIYGKLRNRADFVRMNADHAAASEFDALIQQAFERLALEENWEQDYDSGAPVEFQYVTPDLRHTFVGVLAPSSDQSGRRYPLVAGAILPSESVSGYAHVAPIAYEVFFDGLREQVISAVDNAVEALSCKQFLETHLRPRDTAAADLSLARNVADRFMKTAPIAYLNDLLVTDTRATTLEQALLNLAFYRAFLRRFDHQATNQVIQLPLPSCRGERALAASAWLSILHVLWDGGNGGMPWRGNYLMLQPGPDAAALAACFGNVNDRYAAVMLGRSLDPVSRLDLYCEQDAWKNHCLYAEVSYALGRLLADPALPLQELCGFLKEMGTRIEGAM